MLVLSNTLFTTFIRFFVFGSVMLAHFAYLTLDFLAEFSWFEYLGMHAVG